MNDIRKGFLHEKQQAAEIELLLRGLRKDIDASAISATPVPLRIPPIPHARSGSKGLESPGVSPILASGERPKIDFPKSPSATPTPKTARWQPPVEPPDLTPQNTRQVLELGKDLSPPEDTEPTPVPRGTSPIPVASPRKRAIRKEKARLEANDVLTLENAFEPLKHLGPYYYKLFREVTGALAGDGAHPAATKYEKLLEKIQDGFDTSWEGFLSSQGITRAGFLPEAYERRANDAPLSDKPFRVAIVSPEGTGVGHLMHAITSRITCEVVGERRGSTVVLAVDWTRILPPSHAGVELCQMYCRLVQHTMENLCVFKPELRSKAVGLVGYWKRMVSQHHHPVVPDLGDPGAVAGWRAVGNRVQAAWREGKIGAFCRAMFLVPHVMAEGVGVGEVVLVYSKMECLAEATYQVEGKRVKDNHAVVTACIQTISSVNAPVLLSLSHHTHLELNTSWTILSTAAMATASDVPPSLLPPTGGIPAYIDTLLRAGKRVTLASSSSTPSHLASKKRQLTFLKDAAAAVMSRIETVSSGIEGEQQLLDEGVPALM